MKLRSYREPLETTKTQQGLPNYGQALRLLKNTETLLQKRKKQLRVQALRSQKGSWIELEEEHKAMLREEARAQNQKNMMQYRAIKAKELAKIEEMRKQSQRARKQSIKNRSQSRLEVIENKIRMRQQIRQKSQEHDKKVKQFKKETIQLKRVRCQSLYRDLQSSKVSVSQFQQNHIQEVRSARSRERDDLLKKFRQRQIQLQSLNQEDYTQSTCQDKKEVSTTDAKVRNQLPYNRSSSYLKNRRKSISDVKLDASNKAALLS